MITKEGSTMNAQPPRPGSWQRLPAGYTLPDVYTLTSHSEKVPIEPACGYARWSQSMQGWASECDAKATYGRRHANRPAPSRQLFDEYACDAHANRTEEIQR